MLRQPPLQLHLIIFWGGGWDLGGIRQQPGLVCYHTWLVLFVLVLAKMIDKAVDTLFILTEPLKH